LALAGQQISPEADRIVFQWLKAKCQRMLANCTTSFHADELLLEFLNAHPSVVDVRKLLADYKTSPSISSQVLFNAPEHLQVVIVEEVERFIESVGSASTTPPWQEDLRLERWRLAVEWRLGFKKILISCISRCSRVLQE